MKKLLIATTALVATAGMASADITISGSANAGYYSGLSNKDGVAKVKAVAGKTIGTAARTTTAILTATGTIQKGAAIAAVATTSAAAASDVAAARLAVHDAETALVNSTGNQVAVANLEAAVAERKAELAIVLGTEGVSASNGTYTDAGIYSNAGIVATMTGATDGGITFSASVDAEAGTEIDTGDFELDGPASGTFALGAVSMSGAFGTITFDDAGIDNLYNGDFTSADVSYSTTVGAISLSVAHDTSGAADANSMSAGYAASGMTFTLAASEAAAGTSSSLAVAYALNDSVSVTGKTDQVAGAESVQTITASTTLNGVSVALSSANNSTWDVDLGYTAGAYALTYGVDETDGWTATATSALGGGATFAAGVNSEDSMYAGVSFAF